MRFKDTDGKEVDAVQFNGSSTHIHQIRQWIKGEIKCPDLKGGIHTRDFRKFEMDTHLGVRIVKPHDYVIRDNEGCFHHSEREVFTLNYEPIV